MRTYFMMFSFLVVFFSCKDHKEGQKPDKEVTRDTTGAGEEREKQDLKRYSSEKWHFTMQFPAEYQTFDGELPGETPVINVYDKQNKQSPPYAIHENAAASYIAFLPRGFGVDAPSGEQKTFREWGKNLPLSFEIDRVNSVIYLLENGQPWAASIKFYSPPPGWKDHGSIFVHYAVNNFKAECFSQNSNDKKGMEDCDPFGGDRITYSGGVSAESKETLNLILGSLYFSSEETQRRELTDLITVVQPVPGSKIESPLKITGKATGAWYFEGEAPFKLVDEDYTTLASGSIRAKGEWMTEEFVPFEGQVSFKTPETQRGYLIFNRANASGKPEHDRVYRVPVIFSSKNKE